MGVFTPSSRKSYLNITPANLVRVYPRDNVHGVGLSLQLSAFSPQDYTMPTHPSPSSMTTAQVSHTPTASPFCRGGGSQSRTSVTSTFTPRPQSVRLCRPGAPAGSRQAVLNATAHLPSREHARTDHLEAAVTDDQQDLWGDDDGMYLMIQLNVVW